MTTSDTPDPTPRPATLLESVDHTRSSLLDAVKTGIVAYAAVWVVTFLITGAALLAVTLDEDGDVPWSWSLTAPGQAIAMSSHGTFVDTSTTDMDEEFADFSEGEFDEEFDEEFADDEESIVPDEDTAEDLCCDEDEEFTDDEDFSDEEFTDDEDFSDSSMGGEFTTSMRFNTISLSVLGAMIATLWIASRRAERRRPTPSRNAVLVSAAVTGVTFAVLTWGVAFAARLHLEDTYGHAGTLSILFYGSVLGAAVSLLARRPVARRRVASRLPSALRESVRGIVVYLTTFVVLLVPATAIYAIVQGEPEVILMFPLTILNAAVYGLTLGQLGGVELQGLPFFEDSSSIIFSLFNDDTERIMYVLIPLAVAALLLTIAVLARRSAGRPRTSVDAFWLIIAFGAAGALLTALSAVTTSTSSFGSIFGEGGGMFSFSFAPAQWFFLVMAGWGVVTEIAIRTVGRPLAALVPDKVLDRLTGS